jgi:hypothetical protein
MSTVPDAANLALDKPITLEEIYHDIKTGKPHKARGYDGICLEFFKKTWGTTKDDLLQIENEMYNAELITDQQKYGIIVCIPKRPHSTHAEGYRPLTILNTDFKLVTRIIANRLPAWMQDLLQSSHHCGIVGTSVFEAVATIRDAIAYAEEARSPLCFLTIDFQGVIDNLSHEYLFEVLRKYGFSERFRKRVWNIYNNSTSSVQKKLLQVHTSGVSFKYAFIYNVLKSSSMYPGSLSPRPAYRVTSCTDRSCSIRR